MVIHSEPEFLFLVGTLCFCGADWFFKPMPECKIEARGSFHVPRSFIVFSGITAGAYFWELAGGGKLEFFLFSN
jgi:hypothetical protein